MHRVIAAVRGIAMLALVGCGGSPPRVEPRVRSTCDFPLDSRQRAYLPGSSHALVVLDTDGDRVELADVVAGVAVTTWARYAALRNVVTRTTSLATEPGAPPDPAVRLLPGFPLDGDGPWTTIHARGTVELEGVVGDLPHARMWEEPVDTTSWYPLRQLIVVQAGPEPQSRVRALAAPGAHARQRGRRGMGWAEVAVRGVGLEVEGFVAIPPPDPSAAEIDMPSESEIDWTPIQHSFLPAGTCLYAAPGGAIAGIVVDRVATRPRPAAIGWSSLTVDTAWGTHAYFTNATIAEPAPVMQGDDFQWNEWQPWGKD